MERFGSRVLAVLVLSLAVAGCGGTLPSGSAPSGSSSETPATATGGTAAPTEGTPTGAPATATPGGATAVPATAEPPAATPEPTKAPKPVKAHWDTLGKVATVPISDVHAVRLGGGSVLFLAASDDGPYASVWDAASRKVREITPLDTPRSEYVALPLVDGRAIVVGGTNDKDQSYSSTWIYRAAGAGSWTKTGLLNQARSAPCAAVLQDGRVLVAGGYFRVKPNYGAVQPGIVLAVARPGDADAGWGTLNDIAPPNIGAAMATAELFDPATNTWSTTGSMRYARSHCEAATLADGRVMVVGSEDYESGVYGGEPNTAEIYDPKTGRFSLAGQLPELSASQSRVLREAGTQGGAGGSLVPLENGGAVLIGHTYWWKHQGEMTRSFRYSPTRNAWVEIGQTWAVYFADPGDVPTVVTRGVRNLAGAAAALLPDGRVLVAGGGSVPTATDYGTVPVRNALAYSPKTNRWQNLPSMPQAAGGAVVTMADGSVIIAGGRSILRYTPAR